MKVCVPKENTPGERRTALIPEVAAKLVEAGFEVLVESGAGEAARLPDSSYEEAGAKIGADVLASADVVAKVRAPSQDELAKLRQGSVLIGFLSPLNSPELVKSLISGGVTSFAMDAMPRTTRAQSMDALSSQALCAGYRAGLAAARLLGKFFPMNITAAGTAKPARVVVLGAGVAGLQAIATARRLGAIVTATDVRPAVKEQVASLGAKFIAVEDEEFKQAETSAGYAKEMSGAYKQKQAALIAEHVKNQDIVITTALIPGRPAPQLISKAMIESMRPGSIIVDLAVERGGNAELAKPGEIVNHNGVRIFGLLNLPGSVPVNASSLYARNLQAFVEPLIDKEKKTLAINWDDEIVKGTVIARDGAIVNAMIAESLGKNGTKPKGGKP